MTRFFLSLAIFLFLPAISFSDTLHVPGDYATIQSAIDATKNGDTVLVSWGLYLENVTLPPGNKQITVISESGPDLTYIESELTNYYTMEVR